MPADFSFATINDYVHGIDVDFEDLVSLCLGMSCAIDNLTRERDHWQANHRGEVERARVLKERTDMPLERVRAYNQIGWLRSCIVAVRELLVCDPIAHSAVAIAMMDAALSADATATIVDRALQRFQTVVSRPDDRHD